MSDSSKKIEAVEKLIRSMSFNDLMNLSLKMSTKSTDSMLNASPKTPPVNRTTPAFIEEAEKMAKHIIGYDSEIQNEMLKCIFSIVQNERLSKIEAMEQALMMERHLVNELKYE